MIDVSKRPTIYDIATKARLLYRLAHIATFKARETNYDTPEQTIDELSEFAELFENTAKELHILVDVYGDFRDFSDFEECRSIYTGRESGDSE